MYLPNTGPNSQLWCKFIYGGVLTDDDFINSAFKIWKQALDLCKLYNERKGKNKSKEPNHQDYITKNKV
jgi:hypothetical protein